MSRRNRWLFQARLALISAALATGSAAGFAQSQLAPKSDPLSLAFNNLSLPDSNEQSPPASSDPKHPLADPQIKFANTVVAEVDGRTITLGDVKDAIAELPLSLKRLPFAEIFPGIRARLIDQQALVIRAQHQGLDDDPTVRRLVRAASDRVIANALLEHEITRSVTEAALLQRYDNEIAGKPGVEEVHLRVIMVPTEQEATDIIGQLRSGADFAALAKRSSKDTTAAEGGEVGFAALDGLTPEIGAVAFSMQPGQVTSFPVLSGGSWFVLKVEERRRQAVAPFSVVRESLRQAMLREGVSAVVTAALRDVTVREYDFTGKETEASAANAGARTSP